MTSGEKRKRKNKRQGRRSKRPFLVMEVTTTRVRTTRIVMIAMKLKA